MKLFLLSLGLSFVAVLITAEMRYYTPQDVEFTENDESYYVKARACIDDSNNTINTFQVNSTPSFVDDPNEEELRKQGLLEEGNHLPRIPIATGEEEMVPATKGFQCFSVTVINMNEDIGENAEGPIPLPNIHADIFVKINEYVTRLENFKDKGAYVEYFKSVNASDGKFDEIDIAFFDSFPGKDEREKEEFLFRLFLGSNYLDIPLLTSLCAKKIGSDLNGKGPKLVRRYFKQLDDIPLDVKKEIVTMYSLPTIDVFYAEEAL